MSFHASRYGFRAAVLIIVALTLGASSFGSPPDVQPGRWARRAVDETLANHVLTLPDGREFHGEAQVTRIQAIVAIARLARALENGAWHGAPSVPVKQSALKRKPNESATSWRAQPMTRYAFAVALARVGDYVANGLPHPGPKAKDLGKSEALPTVKIAASPSSPAYDALTFLAKGRMLPAASPLLKPSDVPVHAGDVSAALAAMAAGLTDRVTELGKDENGDTIDVNSFRNRKKPTP